MRRDARTIRILFWAAAAVIGARYHPGLGMIALTGALLDWRGTARWKQGEDGKYRHPNVAVLYRKFGRWTPLAQYGPLAALGGLALWRERTESLLATKVCLWGVGAFLLWGLYLCCLIWVGKEKDDGKTV